MAATPLEGSNTPSQASARPDWAPLIVALVVPILLLQVAVVRPTSTQLARMRGQVARLEATIEQLKAKEPVAGAAAGLLARLGEQESRVAAAEASLDRFAKLEARLSRSVAAADRTAGALDQLDELVDRVDGQTRLLNDANTALELLAATPDELNDAIERAGRLATTVDEASRLAEQLEEARSLGEESLQRVSKLVAQQESLATGTGQIAAAHETLDGLTELATRLNAPLLAVGASHDRLDALVRLKDSVINQTEDLPEAFETFELIVNLQADYQRAKSVFVTVQRLMADLVLLEPSISRIAAVVEPMIDRTTIGGLGGTELRMVLREMQQRRAVALAKLDEEAAGPGSESVAERQESTVK